MIVCVAPCVYSELGSEGKVVCTCEEEIELKLVLRQDEYDSDKTFLICNQQIIVAEN